MGSMTPMPARLLLVEDDETIADFLATELRIEGFEVQVEADGLQGLAAARQGPFDLVLLDWMLPNLSGPELCRRLRRTSQVPIIMLTAKERVAERVEGLDAGANDYLAKPFAFEELLARIRVQLRPRQAAPRAFFGLADLEVDLAEHRVTRAGKRVELTPKEFALLLDLLQHARQVRTRDQIMAAVWGYEYDGYDNVVDVFVRQLRQKVEPEGLPRLIHTVRGVGYVLREPDA